VSFSATVALDVAAGAPVVPLVPDAPLAPDVPLVPDVPELPDESSLLHAPARTAGEAAATVNAHKTRVFIDTSGGGS
jgi:hypothetical protein